MSQINVNRIKDSNEGAPDFPSGVNVGGITSTVTLGVTNLNPTNVNVSGVVTATTLDGNLLATGTPTLGLGVTINASGLNISGVATAGIVSATTLYGNGANITGIALSIAPLNYNPAVFSQASHLTKASGIGLTFNQAVKAGSGNVTLSIANAGVAGTVVENFGVGNSVSYGDSDYGTTVTITPTADLSVGQNYHLSYPSGAFTNIGGDVSYVGTAYTFQARSYSYEAWAWGSNDRGVLGQNNGVNYSSPVQIPGTNWISNMAGLHGLMVKSDGTLWAVGYNNTGELGVNDRTSRSSPVQIPGTTWSSVHGAQYASYAIKTDGTLWVWGKNEDYGNLGTINRINYSSPVQVPGTTWSKISSGSNTTIAIKTDGTAWSWGNNNYGGLGLSQAAGSVPDGGFVTSSPTQIPGTTWASVTAGSKVHATKTDGTLWSWGTNYHGGLGLNQQGSHPGYPNSRSSPTQVGSATDWSTATESIGQTGYVGFAIKTDGTLWSWGSYGDGYLGQNSYVQRSSPAQIPGAWSSVFQGSMSGGVVGGIKTSGELFTWGQSNYGLGNNVASPAIYSSPVQIGSDTTWHRLSSGDYQLSAIKKV